MCLTGMKVPPGIVTTIPVCRFSDPAARGGVPADADSALVWSTWMPFWDRYWKTFGAPPQSLPLIMVIAGVKTASGNTELAIDALWRFHW